MLWFAPIDFDRIAVGKNLMGANYLHIVSYPSPRFFSTLFQGRDT